MFALLQAESGTSVGESVPGKPPQTARSRGETEVLLLLRYRDIEHEAALRWEIDLDDM